MKPWTTPYESKAFTLAAGEEIEWPGMAKWVSIIGVAAGSEDAVTCSFKRGTGFVLLPKGILVPFEMQTEGMRFKNPTASPITFTAAKGFLPIQDNRLVVVDGSLLEIAFDGPQPVEFLTPQAVTQAIQEVGALNFDLPAGTHVLVAAVANVAGVEIVDLSLFGNNGAGAELQVDDAPVFRCIGAFGGANVLALPAPRLIPAGSKVSIVCGTNCNAVGSYNVLP